MRDHLGGFNVSGDLQFAKGISILDDCSGTCTWRVVGTGADPAGTYETAAAFVGLKGMQIKTRVTDPAANDLCTVSKVVALPDSGLLVFRAKFSLVAKGVLSGLTFGMDVENGSRRYQGAVAYYPNGPILGWDDSGGTGPEVAAGAFSMDADAWFGMEIVVDCNAYKYVSAQFAHVDLGIGGEGMYDGGATTVKQVEAYMRIGAVGAAAATVYADSIYLGEFLNV